MTGQVRKAAQHKGETNKEPCMRREQSTPPPQGHRKVKEQPGTVRVPLEPSKWPRGQQIEYACLLGKQAWKTMNDNRFC